jgi:hypothetical protein
MCKSEVAPWLVVRPFEWTVVHRAWQHLALAGLGGREQGSRRWAMIGDRDFGDPERDKSGQEQGE